MNVTHKNHKTILFIDASETMTAYGYIESGDLKSYGEFPLKTDGIKDFGASLYKFENEIRNIVSKLDPAIIGIEDIFSNSVVGFKKLAKLQGIIEKLCFSMRRPAPVLINAASIRSKFDLVIHRILTEKEFTEKKEKLKKSKKKTKIPPDFERDYNSYLIKARHYTLRFPHINFKHSEFYRTFQGQILDVRDPADLKILGKRGGGKISEFDYAKKMVVVDFVNSICKTTFDFRDNDVTDAIVGALALLWEGGKNL